MGYRYYMDADSAAIGDFNTLIFPDNRYIDYSYVCSGDQNPPENSGYYLVYDDTDDVLKPYVQINNWYEDHSEDN